MAKPREPTLLPCSVSLALNPVVLFESQSQPFSPVELGAVLCPEPLTGCVLRWGTTEMGLPGPSVFPGPSHDSQ